MRQVSIIPGTMNDKGRRVVGEIRDFQPQIVGRVQVRNTLVEVDPIVWTGKRRN